MNASQVRSFCGQAKTWSVIPALVGVHALIPTLRNSMWVYEVEFFLSRWQKTNFTKHCFITTRDNGFHLRFIIGPAPHCRRFHLHSQQLRRFKRCVAKCSEGACDSRSQGGQRMYCLTLRFAGNNSN
jgi:hypothetical protein